MAQSFQVSLPAQAQAFDPQAEQEEIARRRRMADLLRQQSAQPEGQMVSGRFVAPSITQRLAGLFHAYNAGQMERRAGEQQRNLGRTVREQEDQGNARIVAAATGPGQSMVQTAGPDVPDFMRPSTQPTAPDPAMRRNNMISAMMSHPNPAVRAQALSLATQPAQQIEWKLGDRFNAETGRKERVFFNPQNPQQTIPFGGQEAAPLEFVNTGGQVIPTNRFTGQPAGAPIQRTMTPGESERLAFDQFQFQNLSPFQREQLRISAANANTAAGQLANAQTNTFFNTGMAAPGGGGVRLNLPPNAPMPQVGGAPAILPSAGGPQGAQPSMPQGASQVAPPAAPRPATARVPQILPGQLPAPGVIGQPPAQATGPAAGLPAPAPGLTPKQQSEMAEEALKRQTAAARAAPAIISQIGTVVGAIDNALGRATGINTGLIGAARGIIPGTSAYDLRNDAATIKANLGFSELQKMREASPTGGALGQVAVQELEALQATVRSLNPNQSQATIVANLEKVRNHYTKWAEAVAQANGIELPADLRTRKRVTDGGNSSGWSIVR